MGPSLQSVCGQLDSSKCTEANVPKQMHSLYNWVTESHSDSSDYLSNNRRLNLRTSTLIGFGAVKNISLHLTSASTRPAHWCCSTRLTSLRRQSSRSSSSRRRTRSGVCPQPLRSWSRTVAVAAPTGASALGEPCASEQSSRQHQGMEPFHTARSLEPPEIRELARCTVHTGHYCTRCYVLAGRHEAWACRARGLPEANQKSMPIERPSSRTHFSCSSATLQRATVSAGATSSASASGSPQMARKVCMKQTRSPIGCSPSRWQPNDACAHRCTTCTLKANSDSRAGSWRPNERGRGQGREGAIARAIAIARILVICDLNYRILRICYGTAIGVIGSWHAICIRE